MTMFSKVDDETKFKLIEAWKNEGKIKEESMEMFGEHFKEALRKVSTLKELEDLLDLPAQTVQEKLEDSFAFTTIDKLDVADIDIFMSTYIGKNIKPKWLNFMIHKVMLFSEIEFLRDNKKTRFTRPQLREFYRSITEIQICKRKSSS